MVLPTAPVMVPHKLAPVGNNMVAASTLVVPDQVTQNCHLVFGGQISCAVLRFSRKSLRWNESKSRLV